MATKSFLSWHKNISFIIAFLFLTSCASLQDHVKTKHEGPQIEEKEVELPNPYDPATNEPVIKDSTLVSRKAPKLGVILGGGGVLTYAQIGVLRELDRQKIPVHSIAGIEWGALVGGAYAKSGRSHEVEWQMLKLPFKKFTESGFFSSGQQSISVNEMSDFLSGLFGNERLENAKVPFSCPYIHIGKGTTRLSSRGFFKNVMKACWPHPPHFRVDAVAANLMGVQKAVTQLRKAGAEVILYVDVLQDNLLMDQNLRKKRPYDALMWLEVREQVQNLRMLGINEVMSLPLSGGSLTSYDSMRSLVRMGQLKSRGFIENMAKRYGY